jgi:hypothetical protein
VVPSNGQIDLLPVLSLEDVTNSAVWKLRDVLGKLLLSSSRKLHMRDAQSGTRQGPASLLDK